MCTTSEHHEHHGLARLNQFLHILLLFTRQTKTLTVAVLATKHHILTYSGDDDISLLAHLQGLGLIGFLAGVHLTVQQFILPSASIAHLSVFGLDILCPIATTGVHHIQILGLFGSHGL